ncbi:A/G-specific adenine glycosylase [Psychrobacter phenylpyruvicus]|uniref:Adenine DNA glycosylase n=1 Tax=Psychrobacter phenylpyruvicus TaxID=29432 RepID=A0A379LPX4_9GAMM|nr:A/G-specific adenine glycosylase [Psychrobacter phenylpyruvicus]SUD91897.1 A/G-specific adenine glycosylase [Psychrobacter phenylpyruvicus]
MNTKFNHTKAELDSFAPRILNWFDDYGRHDLPWQQHKTDTPNPYIVWLSEVMLQQTQVTTVIPYFQRFMTSFPTVQDLANAEWDNVAEHWAGLGYYARARNLHKGAKQLVEIIEETGDFPQTVEGWEAISGVGQSTAGAIVAMGLHGYGVICDGNVKRVITRWAGIEGDITKSATTKELWALAERLTPTEDSGHFAQAMMDMGATLCTRRNPNCSQCPIHADCIAYHQGKQESYPVKAKKKPKPSKFSNALVITNTDDKILWLQRPDSGIWGGLWVLPLQFEKKTLGKKLLSTSDEDKAYESENSLAEQIVDQWIADNDLKTHPINDGLLESAPIKHTLTHFHWYLQPQTLALNAKQAEQLSKLLTDADINILWLPATEAKETLGLPKAMLKVLEAI